MFDHTSRYSAVKNTTLTTSDGRVIAYLMRRLLPQGDDMKVLVEVNVAEGDRLDLITSRTLGDPEQFWRVADANNAMNPFDLTTEPGNTLRVPIPSA